MNKLFLGALFSFLIVLSSCTEDDTPIVIDTENLETGFKLVVNENVVKSDAFAATCEVNGKEGIIIANKVENLSFPLQTENFEAGDFVYINTKDGGVTTWGFGGQALGDDITGLTGYLSILFSDAELRISLNDGSVIMGTSEGVLYGSGLDGNSTEYPYTASFVADIVQEYGFLCEL